MTRPTPRRSIRWDNGASTVEYAAIILLVAALAVALGWVVLPQQVKVNTAAAVCELFGGKNCGVDEQPAAGAQPTPGATPGLAVPTGPNVPLDPNAPVDPKVAGDPNLAGLDPNDPDVKKYNDAKAEDANADKAVTDAQGQSDEVIKQIKDFLLDVVGWTDLQKCISSGDVVACINTLINIVPWGKVFKLLKKIPGAVKLAKRLKELYDQVSGARRRKAAAEKALKEADDIIKAKPKVCPISLPGGSGSGPRLRTADLHTADLHTADLHTADLHTADLHTVDGPRSFGRFGGLVNLTAPTPCPKQAKIKKDIDDALANGRYEDADNLLKDLQGEADRLRDAARQNPTQANKDAANAAQNLVDTTRKNVVNRKLDDALASADKSVRTEGEVADAVRPVLRDFQKKYGPNGRIGEVDVETNKAIIEVASGSQSAKVTQIRKLLSDRTINPTGKPVVLLAERPGPEAFLQLVVGLGGDYRPDEWTNACLSEDSRHVWVTVEEEGLTTFEPQDEAVHAERLGAPVGQQVILSVSRTKGSDLLAMRILEEVARRGWHFIVLDYYGRIRTLDELRARATADPEIDAFSQRVTKT